MIKTHNGFRIQGEAGYYSVSFIDDGKHDGHALRGCPFCGGTDVEICNTHSPAYWIECLECGAECPGDTDDEASCATELEALNTHNRALLSAVERWNTRA